MRTQLLMLFVVQWSSYVLALSCSFQKHLPLALIDFNNRAIEGFGECPYNCVDKDHFNQCMRDCSRGSTDSADWILEDGDPDCCRDDFCGSTNHSGFTRKFPSVQSYEIRKSSSTSNETHGFLYVQWKFSPADDLHILEGYLIRINIDPLCSIIRLADNRSSDSNVPMRFGFAIPLVPETVYDVTITPDPYNEDNRMYILKELCFSSRSADFKTAPITGVTTLKTSTVSGNEISKTTSDHNTLTHLSSTMTDGTDFKTAPITGVTTLKTSTVSGNEVSKATSDPSTLTPVMVGIRPSTSSSTVTDGEENSLSIGSTLIIAIVLVVVLILVVSLLLWCLIKKGIISPFPKTHIFSLLSRKSIRIRWIEDYRSNELSNLQNKVIESFTEFLKSSGINASSDMQENSDLVNTAMQVDRIVFVSPHFDIGSDERTSYNDAIELLSTEKLKRKLISVVFPYSSCTADSHCSIEYEFNLTDDIDDLYLHLQGLSKANSFERWLFRVFRRRNSSQSSSREALKQAVKEMSDKIKLYDSQFRGIIRPIDDDVMDEHDDVIDEHTLRNFRDSHNFPENHGTTCPALNVPRRFDVGPVDQPTDRRFIDSQVSDCSKTKIRPNPCNPDSNSAVGRTSDPRERDTDAFPVGTRSSSRSRLCPTDSSPDGPNANRFSQNEFREMQVEDDPRNTARTSGVIGAVDDASTPFDARTPDSHNEDESYEYHCRLHHSDESSFMHARVFGQECRRCESETTPKSPVGFSQQDDDDLSSIPMIEISNLDNDSGVNTLTTENPFLFNRGSNA